jgi:hypothetical protein
VISARISYKKQYEKRDNGKGKGIRNVKWERAGKKE